MEFQGEKNIKGLDELVGVYHVFYKDTKQKISSKSSLDSSFLSMLIWIGIRFCLPHKILYVEYVSNGRGVYASSRKATKNW